MSAPRTRAGVTGFAIMLLSAAIFGYFGFLAGINWSTPGVDGQPVFFRVLLGWTFRGSAVGFAAAALLTLVAPRPGNVLYCVVGLVGALLMIAVVIVDHLDKQHASLSPLLLVLFAAWNGFGSYTGLRETLGARRPPADAHDRTIW